MRVVVKIAIGDQVLRNSEVEALEVTQELGHHHRCRVTFTRDQSQPLALDELIKLPVVVSLDDEHDAVPKVEIFRGHIIDGSQRHLLHVGAVFTVEAASPSVRHERRAWHHFPESTLGDVVGKLGAKLVGQPRRKPDPVDYHLWGESEMDFLRRLADEHGCFLAVNGSALEVRSEFQDKGHLLTWGEHLLELTARLKPTNHSATGLSHDYKKASSHRHAGVRQTPSWIGGGAKLTAAAVELSRSFGGGGDPVLVPQWGRAHDSSDYRKLLELESARALGAAVLVDGASADCALQAGDLVELQSGEDFALATTGKFGVIRVVHSFSEQHYRNAFVATPWKDYTNLVPPSPPQPLGPVTARVIDLRDPSEMGRIKVSYRYHNGDGVWARIAMPHAGGDRGMMFLPEIDDEVLVGFEGGDSDRPIILGSLWNGNKPSPKVDPDNNRKVLRTRSGNTIEFTDSSDGETIDIYTNEGQCRVQLHRPSGGDPCVTVYSEGDIALHAKNELRMKSKTFVQVVESNSTRQVKGDEGVDISGNGVIKTGMNLALAGGMNTTLKAGVNVESVAGGINNVVGSMVHIQPPGFVPSQAQPKSASYTDPEFESQPAPRDGALTVGVDVETPKTGWGA